MAKNKLAFLVKNPGERLDKYLTKKMPEYSRAAIQKFIKTGQIKVNGQKAKPHYTVQSQDLIEFTPRPKENDFLAASKQWPLEIIAQTKDYLIVNKPAGLITHGAAYIKKITLADLLLAKYPDLAQAQDAPRRAGLVHRLDKDVSGLLIVARHKKQLRNLQSQFKQKKVKKKYLGLVHGALKKEAGKIDFVLARSGRGGKAAARPRGSEGRTALTYFQVKKHFLNYTLLDISPQTGRQHQIRAHLAAIAHPLVGDDLYGTKKTRRLNEKLNLGRIFLFAYYLSFFDLNGQCQEFKISLPAELKNFLKKIK